MEYKINKIQVGKNDQYGNTSYWCEVENISDGKVLIRRSAKAEPPAIGETITGNLIPQSYEKDGKTIKFYKFEKERQFKTSFGKQAEPIELRAVTMSVSYAKDLVTAGSIEFHQLFDVAEKIYKYIQNKIPKQ